MKKTWYTYCVLYNLLHMDNKFNFKCMHHTHQCVLAINKYGILWWKELTTYIYSEKHDTVFLFITLSTVRSMETSYVHYTRKWNLQQFFFAVGCVHQLLPSNVRENESNNSAIVACIHSCWNVLTKLLLRTIGGGGHTHTDAKTDERDLRSRILIWNYVTWYTYQVS
jgi:hypothetical protein